METREWAQQGTLVKAWSCWNGMVSVLKNKELEDQGSQVKRHVWKTPKVSFGVEDDTDSQEGGMGGGADLQGKVI